MRPVRSRACWPGDVPTAGQMTKGAEPDFDAEGYDAALQARQNATLC
ncbi:MAG: hypothetical protein MI785_24455 [Kiloniellales bacterium]|nr:hypothetical protein [Kiloniellales bacterium]